ncbi:MAG: hypothetical protein IT406_02520 [Candidatus Yanofskybacteria bacterium]|nr:hypothetical protein [Candidatus Yanofskybacteria bacterium]
MRLPKPLAKLVVILGSSSPLLAVAQSVPVPIDGDTLTLSKVVVLVEDLINTFFILVSVVIVGVMVFAGLKMATARGDEKEFAKAKLMLRQAVIGAVIVFGVGVIIKTIADFATNPTQILR